MKNLPFISKLLLHSAVAAERAGGVIRDILSKGDLKVVVKGIGDLQTEADRQAQRCIISELRSSFPNDKLTIVGEEDIPEEKVEGELKKLPIFDTVLDILEKKGCPSALTDVKANDVVIWIDPLDGTSEFTQGLLDHVTVLIGISVRGQAVAGVVHQPYFGYEDKTKSAENLGRTAWGMKDLGVFGMPTTKPPARENIVVTTRSHNDGLVEDAVQSVQPSKVERVGGCGHKVMLLIEGKAHAYVFASPGCKKWDTCAPEALLHACGGRLTDMNGNFIRYLVNEPRPNTTGILATAENHQWYLDRLPPVSFCYHTHSSYR